MFKIKIADTVFEIHNLYPFLEALCKNYIYNGEKTDFVIISTQEAIDSERLILSDEHPKVDAYIENICVYRQIALKLLEVDAFVMHAATIGVGDKAYAFTAKSGTGKSTHTSNWLKYIQGTELINDDNPVVRVFANGDIRVFGSPWSGKTPCYKNVFAEVAGFLQLKQAPYNRIERMSIVDGFAALLPSCSVMKWDRRDYVGVCDTVSKMLEQIPVFFLENLPNEEACRLSYSMLSGEKDYA